MLAPPQNIVNPEQPSPKYHILNFTHNPQKHVENMQNIVQKFQNGSSYTPLKNWTNTEVAQVIPPLTT